MYIYIYVCMYIYIYTYVFINAVGDRHAGDAGGRQPAAHRGAAAALQMTRSAFCKIRQNTDNNSPSVYILYLLIYVSRFERVACMRSSKRSRTTY